jgi:alkylated DNA repair dioxygenase AlkB
LPEGFRYRPELVTPAEEQALVAAFADIEFHPYEFHGYLGKRRVAPFGLRYDIGEGRVRESPPMPEFILPLRNRAAAFAQFAPAALVQALVIEYEPGAPIGWHRDRPVFGDVIGVSFLTPCRFRFRRQSPAAKGREAMRRGRTWDRREIILQPRSVYVMRGAARHEWEHSIPPMEQLRYSVTFRTVRSEGAE